MMKKWETKKEDEGGMRRKKNKDKLKHKQGKVDDFKKRWKWMWLSQGEEERKKME